MIGRDAGAAAQDAAQADLEAAAAADLEDARVSPETAARLDALVAEFVGARVAYYRAAFRLMTAAPGYRLVWNLQAAVGGPLWFGARGLWSWFLGTLALETLGLIQIARALFGDLGRAASERADSIAATLELRRQQIAAAEASGSAALDALRRATAALETALVDAEAAAAAANADWPQVLLIGAAVLLAAKAFSGAAANWALERRFVAWRSDRSLASGWRASRLALAALFAAAVAVPSALRFAQPDAAPLLADFPTDKQWRLEAGAWIQGGFDWLKSNGRGVFDGITWGMRTLLDGVETVLVGTPWIVVALVVVMLARLTSGPRVAIFTAAALGYLGLLGFWEKAMTTVSLLGAAALISITLGVPLGIYCARRPKVFAVVRPILDFMQSMPSFVYLIPVVAFVGSGKPAGVVATMIFGSPPVIRFTVLGLQQVPAAAREAALAFGADPRYLLWKVDLPLAAPTIMAGVNQTILLSLAMVVVASLIGAKGLGEDVLQALQYAAAGQGVLAGLAILFCALILDRIVAGRGAR